MTRENVPLGSSAPTAGRSLLYRRSQTPPPTTASTDLTFSCWQTASATPMTSRPHFLHDAPPSPIRPIRRVRSRSLGSAAEAWRIAQRRRAPLDEYPVQFHDWRDILLPTTRHSLTTTALPAPKQLTTTASHVPPTSASIESEDTSPLLIIESSSDIPMTEPDVAKGALSDVVSSTGTMSKPKDDQENPVWVCALYGLINASIVLPVLVSFASIIYHNEAFAPAMPTLVKLTLVSGMVHQVCFSTFSSLPFAVGQVQDAGLIFLSSMATTIVDYCRSNQRDLDELLATATICLPLSTALLGVGLILLGRWQLAQYVQLLPTCVVGGYLAYIGWFCGLAGVGLMAGGASEVSLSVLSEKWYFILPGIASGLLLYVSVRTLRHMAVLPCGILMLLLLFYAVVWFRGSTVEQVTDQGWIRKTDENGPSSWSETWELLKFNKVAWGVLPQLVLTELSMIFVVALSSSLDVAAIEIELQRPLDYNHELQTVGLSNLVSGVTGGYTGSYIFSQTLLLARAGIRSRLAGYMLAATQLTVFLFPLPILAYVPNFFFGSLLSLICIDLLYEWLWHVRDKVSLVEYFICLSTFGLIQWTGVEYGILLGVLLYLLLWKAGFDVGNKEDILEEGEEERDALVSMRKEVSEYIDNGNGYGTLDFRK